MEVRELPLSLQNALRKKGAGEAAGPPKFCSAIELRMVGSVLSK